MAQPPIFSTNLGIYMENTMGRKRRDSLFLTADFYSQKIHILHNKQKLIP